MARPWSRVLRWILGLMALGGILAIAGVFTLYFVFLRDLPELTALEDYRPALTSVVLDRDGNPAGEFYEHRRRITPLNELPTHLVQAFVAAEDDKFYEHAGIDYASILRAAWANFRAGGETVQGASTITQQMVKQLLLSPKRTYRRKIREMVLARRIEQRFTKQEILFLYLNEIYFGAGAYGVGEAARTYFAKDVRELEVGEAALLAGLPKAPGSNSPFRNPGRSENRRQYVLQRMFEEGYILEADYQTASETPPELAAPPGEGDFDIAAYFVEEVRRELVARLGNEMVLRGGLRIETTLDLDLQRAAVEAVRSGLEKLDRRQGYPGPIRTVDPSDLDDAITTLAEENALVDDDGEILLSFPERGGLLGVVIEVDSASQSAQVAFAPGFVASAVLEDVRWARPRDLTTRARDLDDIAKIFSPGDVTTFAEVDAPEGIGRRVTLAQTPEAQGALLSIDVATGEVLAMVGGYDFASSEFNRATQARRQPGSAFKPIIYGAALRHGYTPASILWDRPVVYEDETTGFVWRPENYGRRFLGPITMSEALARSVNNATIHLLRDVGVGKVIRYARELGVEAPLTRDLSLALGSSPVSLLELTRAYAVFAALGERVTPRYIRRVHDRDGNLLLSDIELRVDLREETPVTETQDTAALDPESLDENQILTPHEAFLASYLVQGVVTHPRGTGRRARSLGRPLAGKTGTTNEQGDAWFMGYSPGLATGVWVGFDSKKVLGRGETGGRAALPIWMEFMKGALAKRSVRDFPVPDGIVFARVDAKTGELASSDSKDTLFQAFIEGTEPTGEPSGGGSNQRDRRDLRADF